MIIDGHQHVMLPTSMQVKKLEEAGADKAVLFTTAPHIEQAESPALQDIRSEMEVLYQLLSGSCTPEKRAFKMKASILELKQVLLEEPERFLGFGAVPLGMSEKDTADWVEQYVIKNSFWGIGEFTPGSEEQVRQLENVMKAVWDYSNIPLWIHTFHPVTLNGIQILMELCETYPGIPVIFGHMGGSNWMEVIDFCKTHKNVYLDLSAAFTPLSVRTALFEVPDKCLYGSDAPFGEPKLVREMIEFVSPSGVVTDMALGENLAQLLQL